MKKILAVLVILILAIGGGFVFLVVRSLNVESFQNQIVQSVRNATGREVAIKGGAQMRWLPMPTFEIKQVVLANQAGSPQPDMLTIDRMLVQIDWKNLFKMPVVINQLELENPTLHLERLETNKVNFDLPFLKGRTALDAGALMKDGAGFGLKFDSIKIIDGAINYANKISGAASQISGINGVLKLESILGPLQFQGNAKIQGYPFELNAQMKAYRPLESTDFTIKAADKAAGATVSFEGTLDNNRPRQWLSGGGSFVIENPGEIAKASKETISEQFNAKLVGSFSASLSASAWEIKDFVLVREDNKSMGINASFAQDIAKGQKSPLRITLKMVQANADDFQAYRDKLNWSVISWGNARPVDLTVEAQELLYRQNKLNDVRAKVLWNNRGMSVANLSGTIGADTTFKISGEGVLAQDIPQLTFNYDIAGPAAAAVLKLAPEIAVAAAVSNQPIAVKGSAVLTPQKIDMTFQQARVGTSELKGVITRNRTNNRWDAKVSLSHVNADAYTGWKAPAKKQPAADWAAQVKSVLTADKRWTEYQSDFDVNFDDITVRGVHIPSGQLKGSLDKGVLVLNAASVNDVATTNVRLSGTIAGLGTPEIKLSDFSGMAQSKQPQAFFDKMFIDVDAPWAKRPNAVLNVKLSGSVDKGRFDTSGIISDAVFKVAGEYADGVVRDAAFDLTHPNVQEFVRLLGGAAASVGAYDGVFKASGVFSGDENQMTIQKADVKLGAQQFKGDIALRRGAIVQADIKAATPMFDMERFVSVFGPDPLKGLKALDTWQAKVELSADKAVFGAMTLNNVKSVAAVQDKTVTVSRFAGSLGKTGAVSATGSLTWGANPVAQAQGEVKSYPLAPDVFVWDKVMVGGGAISLSGSLTAAGDTVAKMKSTAKGNGRLTLSDALFVGADIGQVASAAAQTIQNKESTAELEKQLEKAFTSGKTPVTQLTGGWTMDQGVLRLTDAAWTMPAAVAAPTQITLNTLTSAVDITAPMALADWKKLPPIVLNITSDGKGVVKQSVKVSDFIQGVAQEVKAGKEADESQKRAEAQKAEQQKAAEQAKVLAEREQLAKKSQAEIRAVIPQIVPMANEVVKLARQMIAENPSEAGGILLQTASDALDVMNRLHIKKSLTAEQEMQIVEQGQLAILKSKELMDTVTGELIVELRKQIGNYLHQGREGVAEIKAIGRARPDIEQLATLIEYAEQRTVALTSLNELLQPDMTLEQVYQTRASARDAFDELAQAREAARGLQLNKAVQTKQAKAPAASQKGVRGVISRASAQ